MDAAPMRRHDRLDATAIGTLVLCCALWGLQQVAVKVAAGDGVPPLLQAGLRSLGAGALVCGWIRLRGGPAALRGLLRIDGSFWPGLVLAAVFAAEFMALFPGVRLTTASRAVVFLYTAPFFTAVGAHILLPAERLSRTQVAGLLIAFLGVAAAFAEGLARGGGSVVGDALCLLAAIGWAFNTVLVKASPALRRATAAKVLLYQLGGSAPVLLLAAAVSGAVYPWPVAGAAGWLAVGYQTVIVAFASYLAWFWLLQRYPAGRLAGFTFLTPLYGLLAGVLLLGERATPALLVGLVAIAVGLRLVNARAAAPLAAGRSR